MHLNYIFVRYIHCMVRCFVAIECGKLEIVNIIKQIQRILESTGANIKSVEPENMHLTLKFLGEIQHHKVDEVTEIIKETSFEPFNFTVEGIGVFPNKKRPSTIWAGITDGVSDIVTVFEELDIKLSRVGFEQEHRRFHPHLTICRVRSGKNRDKLVDELMRLENQEFGSVEVNKIVLKKSVLTQNGPIYTTLAESHQR